MTPFMLTVENGTDSVPSPLKSMPSTMAFGCATPPTMFHPCVANRYDPLSVCGPQTCESLSASAVPDMPNGIATASRLTSTRAEIRVPIIVLISLFIVVISFFLVL